jgi:hypothetical protein
MRLGYFLVFFFSFLNFLAFGQSNIEWKKAGKYAAFQNDKRISDYVFTEVSSFKEGFAWVNMGNWYGYVNVQLDSITPFKYSVAESFSSGLAVVAVDSSYGYINTLGNEVCSLVYERALPFEGGFGTVYKEELWNLIDSSGNEVLDSGSVYPPVVLGTNRIAVFWHDKWGIVDKEGHIRYPFHFDFINQEGLAYMGRTKLYIGL